jgi:hypothetical protein
MASVINAATSPAALIQTSDGTAVLKLQTGDTDAIEISATQTVKLNAYGSGTLSTDATGLISASDGRYKTKTRSVENALNTINELQPTYYRWNENSPFASEYEELGFIAQEVSAVIPEASPEPETEDKYKNFSDRAILAMAIKAIQELGSKIDELEKKIHK